MQPHEALSARLRREMERQHLSAVALARRAGVKHSFIYDVLNGKSQNPSTLKLAQVAEALGVSLSFLAGISDEASTGEREAVAVPFINQAGKHAPVYFSRRWLQTALKTAPEGLRALEITDGMNAGDYGFAPGDIALIDTQNVKPSPGAVFAVSDGVSCRLRGKESGESQRVLGRVLWQGRGV